MIFEMNFKGNILPLLHLESKDVSIYPSKNPALPDSIFSSLTLSSGAGALWNTTNTELTEGCQITFTFTDNTERKKPDLKVKWDQTISHYLKYFLLLTNSFLTKAERVKPDIPYPHFKNYADNNLLMD